MYSLSPCIDLWNVLGWDLQAGPGDGSLGFTRLVEVLQPHRAVVLFGAAGESIEKELQSAGVSIPCKRAANLADAVLLARTLAQPGGWWGIISSSCFPPVWSFAV
jgi:UDP-N-acetylmuramoylalanine-D-glutamate ligase